jgi:hypothetical protein
MVAAEPELRRSEEPVDDHVMVAYAIVDELATAFGPDHPERGHLATPNAGRELNEHLSPVIEGSERPPRRRIALDPVTEIEVIDVDAGRDWRGRLGYGVLVSERNQLILRIGPGDGGHIGLLVRSELEMVGAPIGVNDEIAEEVWPCRFDQDMGPLLGPGAAFGVADDPAHRVAGGDRS